MVIATAAKRSLPVVLIVLSVVAMGIVHRIMCAKEVSASAFPTAPARNVEMMAVAVTVVRAQAGPYVSMTIASAHPITILHAMGMVTLPCMIRVATKSMLKNTAPAGDVRVVVVA